MSGLGKLTDVEFERRIQQRRRERMDRIDAMPREMRDLVNAYGLAVVDCCTALGIIKPRHIKHLVETVLDNFSPTRGSSSAQGPRTELAQVIRP